MSACSAFCLGAGLGALIAGVVITYAVMVLIPDVRVRR